MPRALSMCSYACPPRLIFTPGKVHLREQGWQAVRMAHLILPQPPSLSCLCGWQMSRLCREEREASRDRGFDDTLLLVSEQKKCRAATRQAASVCVCAPSSAKTELLCSTHIGYGKGVF